MPVSYITYPLRNGYIHHWLVAGPQALPLDNPATHLDTDAKLRQSQRYHTTASGITRQPVEPGPLAEAEFTPGDIAGSDYTGRWALFVCTEDRFVDGDTLRAFAEPDPAPHYARAWAYTEIEPAQPGPATLLLTAYGPADVWVNDAHQHRHTGFGFCQTAIPVDLTEGRNAILVRFEQLAAGTDREPHAIALRIIDLPGAVQVQIPSAIADVAYRNHLERIFATAYLDRDVFVWEEFVTVHWAQDGVWANAVSKEGPGQEDIIIRVQTPSGRIYGESLATVSPGATPLIRAHQAPQGSLRILLMPRIDLYYDEDVRVRRAFFLWELGLAQYSETPVRTYDQRRTDALQHAVRCDGTLFGEIAKMALGAWNLVEAPVLLRHIEQINGGAAESATLLLGLLGMRVRWGKAPEFPKAIQAPLKACLLNFTYDAPENASESAQILYHTCEMLAGQLYPKRKFKRSGQTGEWHVAQGKRKVLAWLRARAAGGFAEWDSGAAFEAELTALAHLMDLVENEALWEMATVVLDKLLFTIALNSFHGVLGGTQGRAGAASVVGGWLAPLGGVTWLLWGVGILNQNLAAAVSLACMEDYELPPLFEEIALATSEELWNREQHVLPDGGSVNKVTYRTPDYLLGAAQDYHPGAPGTREHVWQATLGPGAIVYTNHPANSGMTEAHAPGFWRGNGVLPRVAQWKDALIAVYRLPGDDWMGFTHAYFPTTAFDAYCVREDVQGHPWAFAQKGAGYLALTAAQGFALLTSGLGAYRELRSPGARNVWLCHMGRAALDGDFETFQEKVLALPVTFDELAVTMTTLRGETLTFGWEGELRRDDQPEPLAGGLHYENPYCRTEFRAAQMEIQSANYLMRLKLK